MYRSKSSNYYNNILNEIEKDTSRRYNLNKNLNILKSLNAPYFRPRIFNDIGTIYLELGQFSEAMEIFEKLIIEDPSYHTAYKITKLLLSIGEIDKAFYYADLLDKQENVDFFKGYINKKLGNYEEAIQYFKKLRFTIIEYQGLLQMGDCYSDMHDYQNAKKIYNNLLNTEEQDEALIRLIEIAFNEKDENVKTLLKRFNVNDCNLRRLIQKYQRCVSYAKYLDGKLNKNNLKSYYEEQLYQYNSEKAIKHIGERHQERKDYRYQLLYSVDVRKIYDYCLNNLGERKKTGSSDIYIVDYPEEVGFINNVTTNRLKVTVIPGTNKILTMFPVANYERMMHKKERNDESVREKI